jgi:hypothetical protein
MSDDPDDLKPIQDFFLQQANNFPRDLDERQATYFLFLFIKAYDIAPALFIPIARKAAKAATEIEIPEIH